MQNFFERQDAAKRQTTQMMTLLSAAVICIVLLVYLAVAGLVGLAEIGQTSSRSGDAPEFSFWQPELFAVVTLLTIGVIVTGSLYKRSQLNGGGGWVARSLGGKRIRPDTTDRKERRLRNIVEEMAIASGCPVPQIYILEDERSINAFAAGNKPGDAAIGVTRGAIELLNRDELSGMIAHEFSHLLNGDMKLNIQLIGTLHGILMLATIGYYMMRAGRGSRNSKGNGQLIILGLAVMVVGYVGLFFARMIKSGISRQREYLADASSVQFTRNPLAAGGALKKVAGLRQRGRIRSPEAEECSHMFFVDGLSYAVGGTSTHPPLRDRIKRMLPDWDGKVEKVEPYDGGRAKRKAESKKTAEEKRAEQLAKLERSPLGRMFGAGPQGEGGLLEQHAGLPIPLTPLLVLGSVGAPSAEHVAYGQLMHQSMPDELMAAIHEPFAATAVLYALMIDRDDSDIRAKQLVYLAKSAPEGTAREVKKMVPLVHQQGPAAAIPIADMLFPALQQLSEDQYQDLRKHLTQLIEADDQVTLFEYAIERMVLRHLEEHFHPGKARGVRYYSMKPLAAHIKVLISAVAYAGSDDDAEATKAGEAAAAALKANSIELLPRDACNLHDVDKALDELAISAPGIKQRVLRALVATVSHDGVVVLGEGELLRAIADALDCPMPPLLGTPTEEAAAAAPTA